MTENATKGGALGQHRVVKRPRPVKSCLECRRRKLKCDRLLPCTQCQKAQRTCRYVAEGEAGSASDLSDTELHGRLPKRNAAVSSRGGNSRGARSHSQPRASAASPEDFGARIDRLEQIILDKHSPLSEGSGKNSSQWPATSTLTMRGITVKGGSRTRFFGPSSARVLVDLFDEAKEYMFGRGDPSDLLHPFKLTRKIHKAVQEEHRKATSPIPVFVDSMTPIEKRMADVVPRKEVCDRLVQAYMNGSETIFRVVHIPSFMSQYNQHWVGHQQPDHFLPQLLSILCIGYRFLGGGKGQFQNDREGIHMPTACALVRAWLDTLRGKQLVEFSSLQTEVLALMSQTVLNSQEHETWQHLGLIVRMAMTMGLHRDPSEFAQKIMPFWAEQRRKLWATILELDIYSSVQCSLPSCIREGDFTCQPPSNVNDDELYPNMLELPPSKPVETYTSSRIQVIAAQTLKTRLTAVDLINRIDTLTDYQQFLDIAGKLEQALEDIRYVIPPRQMADPNEALRQWMARVILDMTYRRPLMALYQPFALGGGDCPQQIMTGYLKSCMILLSYMEELDPSTPDYAHIWHLHYLVLGRDIIYASFGVCYFIKQMQSNGSTRESESSMSSGTEPTRAAGAAAFGESRLLSLPRLRKTVGIVIDSMIKRMTEIGTDVKDLVSLAIVFYTYQGEPHESKREVKRALQRIVDAGIQSYHISPEDVSMATMPQTEQVPMINFQSDPSSMINMETYMFTANMPDIRADDCGLWDPAFWSPLTTEQTPL